MNALDHFRKGEKLLAEAQRTPAEALRDESIPVSSLLVAQARAHFEAARTLIAALNTFDMPTHDYDAWEKHTLASKASAGCSLRDLELEGQDGGDGRG